LDTIEFARHFCRCIQEGDIDAVRECYAGDAKIWHNFDGVEQTVDENMRVLEWMKRQAKSRVYEISRLELIRGGYVQQHVLRMITQKNEVLAMPACLFVTVEDGKIKRLEEYLDPRQADGLRG